MKQPVKKITKLYAYRPSGKTPFPTDTDPTSTMTMTTTHLFGK